VKLTILEPYQSELSFFVFDDSNRKGIYTSIFHLVDHGFDYESLCKMPLEEWQFYTKLLNSKIEHEAEVARQKEAQARMASVRQDGKPVGEVIPRSS